jgi:hypothetical protein
MAEDAGGRDSTSRPATYTNTTASVPPSGGVLLPVVAAVFGEPHRGRTQVLVVVVDCVFCGGVHRHITTKVRPTGLTRCCPETGLTYAVLKMPRRRAVRRG